MAEARGEWVGVDTVGEGVDVTVVFERARVLSIGSAGDGGGGEVVGREEEEAKDLWRRRRSRNAVVMGYVGAVEVQGMVDGSGSLVVGDV